jgi:hypothetical protein
MAKEAEIALVTGVNREIGVDFHLLERSSGGFFPDGKPLVSAA